MPSEVPLRFEIRGPVAWLTLNRPAAMNALSPELVDALLDALVRIEADAAIVEGVQPRELDHPVGVAEVGRPQPRQAEHPLGGPAP